MNDTPKIIQVPGIPMDLKETTLDEYMVPLPGNHLARRQLSELRQMALDGARAVAEVLRLSAENRELRERITPEPDSPTPPPEPTTPEPSPDPEPAVEIPEETNLHAPCPTCGKAVSTLPGPWAGHMKRAHNLTGVPRPV